MPPGRASHNRLSYVSSWFNRNLLRSHFVASLFAEGYEAVVKLTLIICKVCGLLKAFSSFPSRSSRASGLSPSSNRYRCLEREGAPRVAKLIALKTIMFSPNVQLLIPCIKGWTDSRRVLIKRNLWRVNHAKTNFNLFPFVINSKAIEKLIKHSKVLRRSKSSLHDFQPARGSFSIRKVYEL